MYATFILKKVILKMIATSFFEKIYTYNLKVQLFW